MENLKKSGRLLSVNWQDGMLIKSSHFDEQEGYFENLNRWIIRNNAVFYGLTRPADMSARSFDVRIDHDGQNWVVVLSRCCGFTASGKIIQIDNEFDNDIKTGPITPGDSENIPVYVYASGTKNNSGTPAGTDLSTRYPYRCFDYRLIVGEAIDIDPADCLKICEIVFTQDRPELSMDFIPPCSTIGAHPVLSDHCHRIKGILTQARQNALNGYRAFVTSAQGESSKFGPEHKLFRDILSDLSIKLGAMLKIHPRPDLPVSPYYFVLYYKEIFGTVESMLETFGDAADMLKKKYADNELYARFIEDMTAFTNTRYNHQEIGLTIKALILLMNNFVEFLNLISDLAGVLPQAGKILHYRQKDYMLQSFSSVNAQPERDGVTVRIEGLNNIVTRDIIATIKKDLFSGVDYRYIMVKIGVNENSTPGRMDPVNVDAENSPENLILKPMEDLKSQSLNAINLNLRGNFNVQALSDLGVDNLAVYVY
ncbi:MAG: type VI secretion system baseplate subunit TssK [Candidatus Zixiibacteriota bacterium]|nr:MAG: type VI secretion system baseplate subunit TssK [candidate division Zixibacteria bacterium]